MHAVILIRHAQSEWNRQGRFTGWADPALTATGRQEAVAAGRILSERGQRFDIAYTSRLARAQDTAGVLLQATGNDGIPCIADWRLNERHYGALQGRERAGMIARVGETQVWRWRRGYLDRPPALADDDPSHPARDPRWADIDPAVLPNGENLADTRARVAGFWHSEVQPQLQAGRRILIASHGNTLRALLMELGGMSVEQVESFEIPTGVPVEYAFNGKGRPVGWHYIDPQGRRAA
jgi:2,3-bisphosphoglycerate-dependent phosphoglycerate mutase